MIKVILNLLGLLSAVDAEVLKGLTTKVTNFRLAHSIVRGGDLLFAEADIRPDYYSPAGYEYRFCRYSAHIEAMAAADGVPDPQVWLYFAARNCDAS